MMEVGKIYTHKNDTTKKLYECIALRGNKIVLAWPDPSEVGGEAFGLENPDNEYYKELKPKHKVRVRLYKNLNDNRTFCIAVLSEREHATNTTGYTYTESEIEMEEP